MDFDMAHARARDAVHVSLDVERLQERLTALGFSALKVHSRAASRAEYLQRPDLGRKLAIDCVPTLKLPASTDSRLTVIFADGLSSIAVARHAIPVLLELRKRLINWSLDSIILATQARVALGDEIGALRHSEAVIMLIGERPGLSSPDSLGIYMTYKPCPGRSDSERNCISNVHLEGLSYDEAAFRLQYLLQQSQLIGKSGIDVKDLSRAQESLPLL